MSARPLTVGRTKWTAWLRPAAADAFASTKFMRMSSPLNSSSTAAGQAAGGGGEGEARVWQTVLEMRWQIHTALAAAGMLPLLPLHSPTNCRPAGSTCVARRPDGLCPVGGPGPGVHEGCPRQHHVVLLMRNRVPV